jgi:hypothetical protein
VSFIKLSWKMNLLGQFDVSLACPWSLSLVFLVLISLTNLAKRRQNQPKAAERAEGKNKVREAKEPVIGKWISRVNF